jgi:hypothetical protein
VVSVPARDGLLRVPRWLSVSRSFDTDVHYRSSAPLDENLNENGTLINLKERSWVSIYDIYKRTFLIDERILEVSSRYGLLFSIHSKLRTIQERSAFEVADSTATVLSSSCVFFFRQNNY